MGLLSKTLSDEGHGCEIHREIFLDNDLGVDLSMGDDPSIPIHAKFFGGRSPYMQNIPGVDVS